MLWIFYSGILILIGIYILLFLIVCLTSAFKELSTEQFCEQWPPIDDDEFLRRCRPGTRRETALKVRSIISEQLGIAYEQIYPEQSFVDDLGAD